MRKCGGCKILLSKDKFSKDKNSKDGYGSRCKDCYSLKAKKWYQNNKERQYNLARQPNMRFHYAKKTAHRRKLSWDIDRETYYKLILKPCNYCNKLPDNTTTGVWLDRLDNDLGYSLVNVVPCCGPCNSGRNANFTPEEWKIMINALHKHKNITIV